MPVSYLLRCIKFPVRVPVLYKIMLMSRCPAAIGGLLVLSMRGWPLHGARSVGPSFSIKENL